MPPSAPTAPAPPPPRRLRLPAWLRIPAWLRRLATWFGTRIHAHAAVARDPEQPRGRRWRHALAGLFELGVGSGVVGAVLLLLFALALLPFTPGVAALRQARELHASVVLSADGEELTRYARNGREWVPLDEVARPVIDALLATEDRRFYDHFGMDVRRTVGAALHTLAGDPQGGSTLTQQLARNLFPEEIGRSRSLTRKLKEALTAFKIEAVYTKDEILEIYLNTVPFLYNAYGIEMAAQAYFRTPASDLTALQAATLVGMLKGTSYYNPVRNPERARERRDLVLRQMVLVGTLSQADYEALEGDPLGLDFERPRPRRSRASHFTEFVRRWLVAWADEHGYNAYGDGLVVHTTLDLGLQRQASRAVARWGDALQAVADVEWGRASSSRLGTTTGPYERAARGAEPFSHFFETRTATVDAFVRGTDAFRAAVAGGMTEAAALDSLRSDDAFMDALRDVKGRLDVGFVAVDPRTGHVRAWVGSRNFSRTPFDHVASARRQPGSTFKPFVYARALLEGWTPDDTLRDAAVEIPLEHGEVWRPTNADGVSGRPMTLREAFTRSKNTVTARLVQDVGARDVARLARAMGVRQSPLRPVPSLALGTSEVTLLEMASAYATIAGGGTYRPPVWVTRIEDRDGNVLAEFGPPPDPALDAETDAVLLDLMRGVVDEGTGAGVRTRFGLRGDLAGKTGTSQDGADGWFLLMHPELVAGAWVGFDDPRVTFRSSYWGEGAHNALFVVGGFFDGALDAGLLDRSATFPPPPEGAPTGPSLLDRVVGWLMETFDLRVEPVEPGQEQEPPPPEPDPDGYDALPDEPPPPDAYDPADSTGYDTYDPPPDPWDDEALREALEGAARQADEFLDDPDLGDVRELAREAEALARELEALEEERLLERAREAADDLKRDVLPEEQDGD
jgi:penicillin-binding protein 1A